MHIPMQVDYGIRALVDLAEHAGEGTVRATEIATRRSIPEPYLARVLHTLQKHGLTRSQRGPQGGHLLAMDPSSITMGMVMDHLGGNQTLVSCLDDAGSCNQTPACVQREVWREVEEAIHGVLDKTTIAELVERTRGLAERDSGDRSGKVLALAGER